MKSDTRDTGTAIANCGDNDMKSGGSGNVATASTLPVVLAVAGNRAGAAIALTSWVCNHKPDHAIVVDCI